MQELSKQNNLPTKYEQTVIDEGWVGKQKRSLQILFERGLIDPGNIGAYTRKGRKVENVLLDVEGINSIDELMQKQADFKEEITLLQYHAQKLGVVLDRSPKCHPEIAGEGIEYAWAFSKQ